MATDPIRFSATLAIRCTPELNRTIDQAARQRGCKPAEWVRQALHTCLALEGVDVTVTDEPPQQFALVRGGTFITSYIGDRPDDDEQGGTWLPLVNEDSEPFDSKIHWRLAPSYRVESDRVVRVYPVVIKGWEHA